MSPFEAGLGTGKEAFVGSGKEARGVEFGGPQLIAIAGLDESNHYDLQAWVDQQIALTGAVNSIRSARPRLQVALGVWHYNTQEGEVGGTDITPPGQSIPAVVTERFGRRNRTTGEVDETAAEWISHVKALAPHPIDATTQIVFLLDDSGSFARLDWKNLPVSVSTGLRAELGHSVRVLRWNRSDEQWLGWLVEAADWFLGLYGP